MNFARNLAAVGAMALSTLSFAGPASAEQKIVDVAYQLTTSPWIARLADGAFETETGYTINWHQFNTGAEIISAMASGSIDLSVLGSSPLAVASTAGLDIKLFWVLEDIASAEALYVRNDSGISSPQDLVGKRLAVPFASTSHYQLMYALKKWGVDEQVTVLNLDPNKAAAAWERKDIDGAFIWGAAMARLKRNGTPLVTAGQICEMGRCTFEGMAVSTEFARDNAEFMQQFTSVIDHANRDYRNNPAAWAIDSANIKLISDLFGADASTVTEDLSQYKYPSLKEQASCAWLGCGAEGGAAKTLRLTAEFLKSQGRIDKVLDDYSGFVADDYLAASR
ncbi:taurine ABC transporter substrate-binding protein (plasmid) [Aminobacter sp. SR38]|jgi:taurine transport system substrate-binding protein|uniref:taurine ABC transporter substrate-binding protein n=1 Tax=Aminobacter sp. SR38 TaxID=2774562 RepID=UPI0017848560|nr:taurine ABC transporter substrate-binding protein [Aminobacter sp. SR38]QOF75587.1 taurine ABC transporter substrate-binding protein [Aminobacter sp. SR38]